MPTQTSRELVKRTLEFDGPARVPQQLWSLPWTETHHGDALKSIQADFPDDIIGAPSFLKKPLTGSGDRYAVGSSVDEWGCTFVNIQAGVIGEVKEPLIKDWSDLDKLRLPVERLSVDVEKVNEFCRSTEKFTVGGLVRPFERIQFLRGTENVFMDLAYKSAGLFELLERMQEFYCQELEVWANSEVDSLVFMDDWGTQQALLISPATWREIFKPLYKEYIDIAHSHGKKILMHSDGYTMDIIEDLIELGLDAINTQIFCMPLDELSKRYAGRITFWGEIDRQHLLVNGSPNDIASAVCDVRAAFWRDGGVIAQCEFGPGAKPENVRAVYETWNES